MLKKIFSCIWVREVEEEEEGEAAYLDYLSYEASETKFLFRLTYSIYCSCLHGMNRMGKIEDR